jgi:uncharacterized protein (TIGR02271 family)
MSYVIDNIDTSQLRQGMPVHSGEGRLLGPIEALDADSITVRGQRYELSSIERIESGGVYLTRQVGASADRGAAGRAGGETVEAEGDVRIQVHEERLDVQKRERDRGEVRVRRRVETEQQTVPVELTREEVRVQQVDTADRPATEAETADAFREGTIRVPLRGEEAVAHKETVVTGEVVIDKARTTEQQQVSGTVRRERVEVDEHYDQARAAYRRDLANRPGAPTLEEAEPHFRTGYAAAVDQRHAGKAFEEVEPDLRQAAGAADEDAWERIKREVREGFTRARER